MPECGLGGRCPFGAAFAADQENDGANLLAGRGVLPDGPSDFWADERQASIHSGDLREEECDFIGESLG